MDYGEPEPLVEDRQTVRSNVRVDTDQTVYKSRNRPLRLGASVRSNDGATLTLAMNADSGYCRVANVVQEPSDWIVNNKHHPLED